MEQVPKKELNEKDLKNEKIYKAQLVIDKITSGKIFKNQKELDEFMDKDLLIQQKLKETEEYEKKEKY